MPSSVPAQRQDPPEPRTSQVLGLLTAAVLAVGLLGCANAAPLRGVLPAEEERLPFIGVTPVGQPNLWGCGFASMASVALYHGVPAEKLSQEPIKKYGTRPLNAVGMVNMARELGLVAFGYEGSVDDLKKNLAKGRPMVVLLSRPPRTGHFPSFGWAMDTSQSFFGEPHWVVVLGVNSRGEFLLWDPAQGHLQMASRSFADSWQRQSNVCVVTSPPPEPSE